MKNKNTKIFLVGIVTAIVIIFAVVFCVSKRAYSFNGNKIKRVAIGNNIFYSEAVSNAGKMQRGLTERNSLCQSCAMLFQFSSSGKHTFWMKNMRFPLDIIWISDGKVVYLEKNVSEKFSDIMIPPTNADQVIEINSGISDKLGIKIGDLVQ